MLALRAKDQLRPRHEPEEADLGKTMLTSWTGGMEELIAAPQPSGQHNQCQ
jgi:hypothetical protein